jgi:hypothetical protein
MSGGSRPRLFWQKSIATLGQLQKVLFDFDSSGTAGIFHILQ